MAATSKSNSIFEFATRERNDWTPFRPTKDNPAGRPPQTPQRGFAFPAHSLHFVSNNTFRYTRLSNKYFNFRTSGSTAYDASGSSRTSTVNSRS